MSSSIQDILRNNSKQLEAALNLESSSARIEIQGLLQAVLQVDRAWLFTHSEQLLSDEQATRFLTLYRRRLNGEPIAYLLGEREFYGLMFKVNADTLIPRPETELLVDLALQRIPQKRTCRVLDLGTGSGAIALSIADARPDAEVWAVDISVAALEVAQFNAQKFNLWNTRLLRSNWFNALGDKKFDIIISNPPYVAADHPCLQLGDLRFEPRVALASGADGLADIQHICAQAAAHLNVNGWLLVEHGYDQAAPVRALLHQAGFTEVFSACDLARIERISGGMIASG